MNLEHAIKLFLGQYKPTTRRANQYPLGYMSDYIGHARPITAIKPADLIEYTNTLYERNYSPHTCYKHIKIIKTFFNWLVKIGELDASPAAKVRQANVRTYVTPDKAMTDDEYHRVLEYIRYNPRNHAIFLFLGDTGCRAGGAAGLKVDDIDLDNLSAIVTEKKDKTRHVWFGDACARALRVWLIRRPSNAGSYIFSRDHKQLSAAAISQIIRRACITVGVRSLGAHSMRHRKGHQFNRENVSPIDAAIALGHENPQVTIDSYYGRQTAGAVQAVRKLAQPAEKPQNIISLKDRRES
jgi:integrase